MKRFISGLVVGILIATSVTTFAASRRMIEVIDSVKRIVVNKVEQPFDKGNAPFVYNGTTYVPLRFVANALGESVNWDAKTGTVYIGDMSEVRVKYWKTDLVMMNGNIAKDGHGNSGISCKDNMGNVYTNYLTLINVYTGAAYAEYGLNGKYKTFKAILGLPEDLKSASGTRVVNIYIDDKKVYTKTLEAGAMHTDINIDLTDAKKIKFELEGNPKIMASVGFFNGEFIE